jgi:hypothetical protein
LMFGRSPWLPSFIARRSMARTDFAGLIRRVTPWLMRAERMLCRRISGVCAPPLEYAIGAACLLLSIVLVLPIPMGNMLPALAICLMALGILERDGLWVILGLVTAVAGVALVYGVLLLIAKAAILVFQEALSFVMRTL